MHFRKGNKRVYGLLGRNISYSLSPCMHNAAFRHFEIPAEYAIFDMEERGVDGFFRDHILNGSISGINVTVPYKIKIKEILSACAGCSTDGDAEFLGAVNTVKAGTQGVTGYNTDGKGFYEDLRESAAFNPRGEDIFVLGAGGAGRAICLYLAFLCGNAPKSINVFDVDKAKLSSLKTFFDASRYPGMFCPVEAGEAWRKMRECGLVVNATPIGSKKGDPLPFSVDNLREGMILYDLVYRGETEIVKRAREKGLVAVNALGMLINQAALAFGIWTGMPVEETRRVMRAAANAEIKTGGGIAEER